MRDKKKFCAALIVLLQKKKPNRKKWTKERLLKRNMCSHVNLTNEIRVADVKDFNDYFQMNEEIYYKLLDILKPLISKEDSTMRESISANERLALTLRFLATGRTFKELSSSVAMGVSTISGIVMETCEAIIAMLKNYIKMPESTDDWKEIATSFETRWDFGNCVGAINGKHVAIRKPPHSGSMYSNYKGTFSIVLMAIVNANYEFLMVDAGGKGGVSDGGDLFKTTFGRKLRNCELNLPPPSELPNSNEKFPFVFVADEAFALESNVMKPYCKSDLTPARRTFNYRISRVHQVVENAFGILTSRFGVFQKQMNLCPEKASLIVMTCCYLHNFLIKENGSLYCSRNDMREENSENGQEVVGNDEQADLLELQRTHFRNVSSDAEDVRDKFCRYFSNEGRVS